MSTPEYYKKWAADNAPRLAEYRRKWSSENKSHLQEYKRKWAAENHDRTKESRRLQGLKQRFGSDAPAHNLRQLEKQDGKCDLCGEPLPERTLDQHQDHNHETLQLRGVCCRRCNTGLHYLENTSWRQAAEKYLARWNNDNGI